MINKKCKIGKENHGLLVCYRQPLSKKRRRLAHGRQPVDISTACSTAATKIKGLQGSISRIHVTNVHFSSAGFAETLTERLSDLP